MRVIDESVSFIILDRSSILNSNPGMVAVNETHKKYFQFDLVCLDLPAPGNMQGLHQFIDWVIKLHRPGPDT